MYSVSQSVSRHDVLTVLFEGLDEDDALTATTQTMFASKLWQ